MPKGIPNNGINKGWFKQCLNCGQPESLKGFFADVKNLIKPIEMEGVFG